MIPPFAIAGGLTLAAARVVATAGLMAAFGGLLYRTWLAPPGLPSPTLRRLDRAAWGGLGLALAGALVWLAGEAADLAGAASPANMAAVLAETRFGHLVAARIVLLGAACLAFAAADRAGRIAAASLAGAALLLQAGHSHAAAMAGPGLLLLASALHLLAAGAWLGTLVPLLLTCAAGPPAAALRAARRFSPLGVACVAGLAITATMQSWTLIGSLPGLLGTAYGWMALLKLGLFAALVALAAANRRAHAQGAPPFDARAGRRLVRAVGVETALGLATILAAGVLTGLPPSMHVQTLWPLPWTLSLDAAREDPDYRVEAIRAACALVAAAVAFGTAVWFLRHRSRLVVALLSVAGAGCCLPHFGPLLVPAWPTTFYRAPATHEADGAALYTSHCAACHGADGRGNGPVAHGLAVPPANLMEAHLMMHSDGELFWWIGHGIAGPDGRPAMPAFPGLSEDDTWALIDFIRRRNGHRPEDDGVGGMRM